jgi:hypothetical protein
LASFCSKAQTDTPAITQLRQLMVSAKTNFTADMGKAMGDDTVGHSFYETKNPTEAAQTAIMQVKASGQNIYMIILSMEGDNLAKAIPLVDQYLNEMNHMVKTGDYTGEDRKDSNGKDLTELKDKNGKLVLRYTSDKDSQNIYLYGYN